METKDSWMHHPVQTQSNQHWSFCHTKTQSNQKNDD